MIFYEIVYSRRAKKSIFVVKVVEQQYLRMLFMLVKHIPLLHDIGCQDVRKGFQNQFT